MEALRANPSAPWDRELRSAGLAERDDDGSRGFQPTVFRRTNELCRRATPERSLSDDSRVAPRRPTVCRSAVRGLKPTASIASSLRDEKETFMESPLSVFFRMHWDHEPETRKPFRIKASVFRFMERPHDVCAAHRAHEPASRLWEGALSCYSACIGTANLPASSGAAVPAAGAGVSPAMDSGATRAGDGRRNACPTTVPFIKSSAGPFLGHCAFLAAFSLFVMANADPVPKITSVSRDWVHPGRPSFGGWGEETFC